MLAILNSTINMIGKNLYNHLMSTRIFTLIMTKIVIRTPKIMRQITLSMICICQSSHTNCVFFFILSEKWPRRREKKYPNHTRQSTFCCSENTASQTSLPFDLECVAAVESWRGGGPDTCIQGFKFWLSHGACGRTVPLLTYAYNPFLQQRF